MKTALWVVALVAAGLLVAGCGGETRTDPSTVTVTSTLNAPPSGAGRPGPPPGSALTNADPDDYRAGGSLDGDVAFVSPTGNVWCRLGRERYTAGCQAVKAPVPAGARCVGTRDYPVDQLTRGFFLDGETVTPACFNQGVFSSPEHKRLPYGYTITGNGYTCTSRTTGITCNTPSGEHGFVLSMQEARAF
ncbi:DUF6636 domain-containing protein [Gordonia sp. (in: high G+C Gram-positive bacteria)]|uniref:DUF6636 domain-containing protein n=1 Tax=Gordonia sp. (in: high G+C Gram-positive bacteria) TaxID=84139 RepID=UPI0039E2849A